MVDDLYAGFVATLAEPIRTTAAGLAVALGLAPSRDVPWSQVFGHEITLGAPALLAEAMPAATSRAVRDATLAHALAVLDAFATDRVEDQQVRPTPALHALLEHARWARDAALARVTGTSLARGSPYDGAWRETAQAIAAERTALREGRRQSFGRYVAIARGKQRLGFPASLALARAAGLDARGTASVAGVLDAATLGLQLHDDVIDWEDDLRRGGAWALAMALHVEPAGPSSEGVRAFVHRSGVLARMLAASARFFRAARRRAEALGADRVARWAREREETVGELARREAAAPGFANRAHSLSAWSKVVLA